MIACVGAGRGSELRAFWNRSSQARAATRRVSRDVLETFLMLASDPSWEAKLKQGVGAGLSADAAVERARGEHRSKLNASRDPYLRERLHDFDASAVAPKNRQ